MDHPETLPVAKRPKTSHSATQPDASAVARFFETHELLQIVLNHLHADRIDLLALAAVCKGLRTPALQVWIRHLDFNQHDFEGKLKLLEANTHLLPHIRCLRILDRDGPDREPSPSFWNQAKTLFSLLAAHGPPHHQGPLLDISIDVDNGDALYQALQLIPRSAQRICALRLTDQSRFTPREANKAARTLSTTGWISLALLLKDALPGTPSIVGNLRVFGYRAILKKQEVQFRQEAKQIFWSTLAAQCQSLHDLRLAVSFGHQADHLLRHGHFTTLKVFQLKDMSLNNENKLDAEAVDIFLNRHAGLERLSLERYYGSEDWLLPAHQTFSALHDLELGEGISFPAETNFQFVRRHSRLRRLAIMRNLKANDRFELLKSLLSTCTDTYKHLPAIENVLLEKLMSALVRDGARPLRASVRAIKPTPSGSSSNCDPLPDLNMLAWSGVRPEDVEDLTFLNVILRAPDFDRQDLRIFQLFACGLLPNLTELHFLLRGEEGDFPTLTELLHQLIPSTSIRVLCITVPDRRVAEEVPIMMLTRHLFPLRFELLSWRQGAQACDYFRFVADYSETQNSASPRAPQLGKLGRLQAIPERVVLTQVGSDGVWSQKTGIGGGSNPVTVLDHSGV
ncbi:unnamed protein product [Tilletia controversa]|uniref:Uncharacterized protein n=4 Tax=Tilletia TaxID=13289 RepID=A0A8X7SU16_9BASI|nr:hypothetical protein CF336_g7050 [Tilletia laevis]KAE8187097.1 hypothetical protein CF328_g7019 [Tilletia controversa]KAE8249937.1 hypothetical protein A4X03_0g6538 [Tilletia caries]KAE8188385.1 hypothetical protein CF335_g6910 [Tilletia laevis]KAE8241435.1 hypothetical protein A4X06_0g7538 [Tilletia controversa]